MNKAGGEHRNSNENATLRLLGDEHAKDQYDRITLASTMYLYLLRHGIAEDGSVGMADAQRALTGEGRRKLKLVLAAAVEAKVSPSLILSSPLKRTMQTAEVAAEVLHFKDPIQPEPVLQPGTNVEQIWDEIRLYKDLPSLLLVGHNPTFSELAGYLLGSPGMQVDFKKGALMKIELTSFPPVPRGALRWYLTSKLASRRQ